MTTAGWRGRNSKGDPHWKLQVRREIAMAANKGYSMGGLPRKRPREAPTLPKISCLDKPEVGK